jgi:hypothetical protein
MDARPPTDDAPAAPPDEGLRALGFLVTVAGGLAAGIGSMLEWVSVDLVDVRDVPSVYPGIDLTEGKVALALAVIAVVAVLVSRVGATATSRRGAVIVVIVAGIAITGIAAVDAITAEERFVEDEIERQATSVGRDAADIPEELRTTLEERIRASLGIGIWVTFAGGLLTATGGVLTLVWATRNERRVSEVQDPSGGAASGPEPPPPPEPGPPA